MSPRKSKQSTAESPQASPSEPKEKKPMDAKEKIQAELDAKKSECADLSRKIEGCDPGPVRMELKRQRNNLTGELVNLRQRLIAEELKSEKPQHVPRLEFAK